MSGLFGGGSSPTPPPPPPPPTYDNSAEVSAAAAAERKRRSLATGRASTMLTAEAEQEAEPTLAYKKLLGS
jgi:hypothetical protein